MKKLLLLGLVTALFAGTALAAPVDVNQARNYGRMFVRNSLEKRSAEVELSYTKNCENGTAALYVFSFEHGYVMVAADDCAYPILAYSENCEFDAANLPDGFLYYMEHFARQIQYAVENNIVADDEIAEQWYLLGKYGVTSNTRSTQAVSPLIATTWNQGYPYNYYAPAGGGAATGGHCYAGCVATAMSQVMKRWDWPETGNGEHSYSTSSYGGTLSANFGETTYNWSIMPNSAYTANAGALAIALLMYHCGISVNMNFNPGGSGAYTEDVPDALKDYFRYGSCTYYQYRDNFTKREWEDMLIENLDRGLPIVYGAQDDNGAGGHAFNCDGYDNQRRFHFNFGWSGFCDNYFYIDAITADGDHFNTSQKAVFDIVPDYIYEAMVAPIETVELSVPDAISKTVTVSFTVPEVSATGAALSSIDRINLKRNDVLIHTFENPQPGETIVYEDQVEEYGAYVYSFNGVNNNVEGKKASKSVVVGPNCTWKLVCSTTNFQGWNKSKLQIIDANGVVFKEVSLTNSTPISDKFQMPEGNFTLEWVPSVAMVPTMTISLKNSANQQVYNFTGNSNQLEGTLFSGTNDCEGCTPPTQLTGDYYYESGVFGTHLTWVCDYTPNKFKIYRSTDGVDYHEIASVNNTENEYYDPIEAGDYYYKVTAFSSACESTPALTGEDTDYVYVTVTDVNEGAINAQVYPNPVEGTLYVKAAGILEVSVYDVLGQRVYRRHGASDAVEINTADFEPGIYMINVTTTEGVASRRVIVK